MLSQQLELRLSYLFGFDPNAVSQQADVLEELLDHAHIVTVLQDHMLVPARYMLLDGLVAREVTSTSGDPKIALLFEAGDLFEHRSSARGPVESHRALRPSDLLQIAAEDWARILLRHTDLTLAVVRKTEAQVDRSARRIAALMGESVRTRMARYLLRTVDRSRGEAQLIRQYDIARYFGVQPETVSRTLRQFIREGIVSRDGEVLVLHDLDRLGRIASNSG